MLRRHGLLLRQPSFSGEVAPRDLASLVLAAVCWGLGTVISKAALVEFPPTTLLTIQLAASLVVLTAIMRGQGISLRGDGPRLVGRLGILNPGLAYALGLLGLLTISASVSVLLWMDLTSPFVWACLLVLGGFGVIGFLDDYDKVKKAHHAGLSGRMRLFLEFAITLAAAILISAVVSLTLTPMMCAKFLRHVPEAAQSRFERASGRFLARVIERYGVMLDWVLERERATLIVAVATLVLSVLLYVIVPKGFFPVQDTGAIQGISEAPQSISFAAMAERQQALARAVLDDPAVASLSSFIGVDGTNTTLNSGRFLINLKPKNMRDVDAVGVVALDDVLTHTGLVGVPEDPGEVDQALAGVLEAAGLVHVLDVVLQDPALVLLDEVDRVARPADGPEQVELQVHQVRVGGVGEDVVGGP